MKAKLNTIDLFSGREDVRKYLNVDIMEETGVTLLKKREGKH